MQKYFLGTFSSLVMFIAFTVVAGAQESPLKEGKWSMTMKTHMDNMPPQMAAAMKQMQNLPPQYQAMIQQQQAKMGVQMNADGQGMTVTVTHCMTNQHLVPSNIVPKNMADYCQATHEFIGNTVNFHTTCDHDDMQMELTGSMTYAGDTMQGHIKSHQEKAGHVIDSTVDMTGQYLGPC